MGFMNFQNDTAASYGVQYDEGLRKYMLSVFSYMAGAFGLTGLVAYLVASSPALISAIYSTPLQWVIMFAPVIFTFFFAAKIYSMSLDTARILFWLFAGVMGLSLSWVFMAFTGTSIARVFFISSSMFGAMALYGNNTKRDLSAFGSFLIMGVIGLIIASLVNLFLRSTALNFATSFLAVIIFTGLTAYDVQRLKDLYFRVGSGGSFLGKASIMGALTLYFDFINIFLSLLHLLGDRK